MVSSDEQWPSQGQRLVYSSWQPQHLAQWGTVLVFRRTSEWPSGSGAISLSHLLDGAASHSSVTPRSPSKPQVLPVGVVASGQAGRSLSQKPRKCTSFYFLLICSVLNAAGIEPFIFPIPEGLGRQGLLPSSLLCCLIAGEFRPFLSSVFGLFQVYCPMCVGSAGFCHVSFSPTPLNKGGQRHSSEPHSNTSDPSGLPFLILLPFIWIHFVLIFLFSFIFFLLFSVSACPILCPSIEG